MAFLRHLALRCRDMEHSRRFYEQVIGWRFVGYRPSGKSLDLSDGVNNITILQHDPTASRPQLPEGDEHIHFGVIVEDLPMVWQRAKDFGAVLAKEDVKARNEIDMAEVPAQSFKVLDPDGNVVDVTCNRAEWRGVAL